MDKIATYVSGFICPDNPQLKKIAREETSREDVVPSIGLEVGKLLGLLIRLTKAQRVLELGSCLGYSTIWLAEALRSTGGGLVSVECDERFFNETRKNVSDAGLADVVELILGDAAKIVHELRGPFDVILQDSDKALYPVLLERCVELTREHGLIVADDGLFKPMGMAARQSKPVHEYNRRVFSDPRLYSTILPIGDGVTISVKIGE